MAERRSMKSALEMSHEKVAFIHGERDAAPSAAEASQAPAISSAAEPPPSEPLVPLTTRLRASTAEALRRAHLKQKLNRRKPDAQQEMVEEAVAEWLRTRGFQS